MDDMKSQPAKQEIPTVDSSQKQTEVTTPTYGNSYGKKSWKKWLLIYVILAGVIYAGVYYFFFANKPANPYSVSPSKSQSVVPSPTSASSQTAKTSMDPNTGNLYTDLKTRLNEVIK